MRLQVLFLNLPMILVQIYPLSYFPQGGNDGYTPSPVGEGWEGGASQKGKEFGDRERLTSPCTSCKFLFSSKNDYFCLHQIQNLNDR